MVSSISSGGMSSTYISQMREKMFQKLDSSGDGKLDSSEISKALSGGSQSSDSASSLISALDTDEDGLLSQLELDAGMSKLHQEMKSAQSGNEEDLFSRIDTDGDGSVSKEEFVSNRPEDVSEEQATELWGQLDSSGAGSLTASQFASAMAEQGRPAGPPPGPPPEGLVEEETAGESSTSTSSASETSSASDTSELLLTLLEAIEQYASSAQDSSASNEGEQQWSELFGKIDTDGDGSVSKEEFVSNRSEDVSEEQANNLWSRLDSDGAGSLTESQFVSAMSRQGPPPGGVGQNDTGDSFVSAVTSSSEDASQTVNSTGSSSEYDSALTQLLAAAMNQYLKSSSNYLQGAFQTGALTAYA